MEELPKKLKVLFSLMLLGAIYGGAIGAGIALLTGDNVLTKALAYALALALAGLALCLAWTCGFWVLALALARVALALASVAGDLDGVGVGVLVLVGAGALALTGVLAWGWVLAGQGVLAGAGAFLEYLAKRNKTTPEALIENHIAWIFFLPIAIFHLLFSGWSFIKSNQKSKSGTKQRAWDVGLIITFTQDLTEVFPEEWDEWQHWIRDIMDSRIRMQSKGMNHHLVSLITFYRLNRFAFHIGIDKVFILATRRATR